MPIALTLINVLTLGRQLESSGIDCCKVEAEPERVLFYRGLKSPMREGCRGSIAFLLVNAVQISLISISVFDCK